MKESIDIVSLPIFFQPALRKLVSQEIYAPDPTFNHLKPGTHESVESPVLIRASLDRPQDMQNVLKTGSTPPSLNYATVPL